MGLLLRICVDLASFVVGYFVVLWMVRNLDPNADSSRWEREAAEHRARCRADADDASGVYADSRASGSCDAED